MNQHEKLAFTMRELAKDFNLDYLTGAAIESLLVASTTGLDEIKKLALENAASLVITKKGI